MVSLREWSHWEYEEEWRLIVMPELNKDIPHCRIYKFPKEALTGVIFGCDMAPEDKYMVREWLKEGEYQAHVYEAKREIGAYSIRIPGLSPDTEYKKPKDLDA